MAVADRPAGIRRADRQESGRFARGIAAGGGQFGSRIPAAGTGRRGASARLLTAPARSL